VAVERFPAPTTPYLASTHQPRPPGGRLPLSPTVSCAGSTPALLVDLAAATALPAATAQAQGARPRRARAQASPRDTARGTVGTAQVMVDYGRPPSAAAPSSPPTGSCPTGRCGAPAPTPPPRSSPRPTCSSAPRACRAARTRSTASRRRTAGSSSSTGQTGQWGTDYDASKDRRARAMQTTTLRTPVEQFTIAVEPQGGAQSLVMRWDTVQAGRAAPPGALTRRRATSPVAARRARPPRTRRRRWPRTRSPHMPRPSRCAVALALTLGAALAPGRPARRAAPRVPSTPPSSPSAGASSASCRTWPSSSAR
jgi:hypothetical protein